MFRRENTVPKMSFASSSALNIARPCVAPFMYAWEEGLEVLPVVDIEGGIHRFL